MDRLSSCLAIVALGFAALWATGIDAAEQEAQEGVAARLERLEPSKLLLKAPSGLSGGFTVARTAPDVDFAVFPDQFSGARLWSSWGDILTASDHRFYAAIGDHDAPHGTTFVYCIDPTQKAVTRVIDCNQIVSAAPDKYSPGKIHAPLVQADDGGIYVFGFRGSVRKTGTETSYRGDWLLRYRPATGRAENLGVPLPFSSVPVLEYCPALRCLYGPGDGMLRAASRPSADGIVYGISKDGVVFAFDTNTETVTEIAKAFVAGKLYTAVCRLDPTDAYLYYIPGAHGKSAETGTPVIQLYVKTRRCKVLVLRDSRV